eukprot:TRINITY_DN10887_c0_g1_i1.p2 TRINITY_DN10887_c0_g1~~TRINITY_DN10887_c0_g1_i1.p2  ORF type:complete len:249 (+),score=111.58 TRINITY_DN10887_c0_g1_i1:66-812(+)
MTCIASGADVLKPTEKDIQQLLACHVHHGTKNMNASMERYTTARRKDGVHILNLHMTWEKLMLAARCIVAVENPADVVVISARAYGQRAVLKFAQNTGATPMAGRFCPGTFTNQKQEKFSQPRLIIVTDPRTDHQAITESAYVNVPIIALCDTDSPLKHVDIAIPCNNRSKNSIGLMYWLLAREVQRMRNDLARSMPWEVQVDLFFYRDPEDVLKKEAEEDRAIEAVPTHTHTADNEEWGEDGGNTWA